jgi:hypothetical protein
MWFGARGGARATANSIQVAALFCLRHFHYSVTSLLGNERAVSRICCPLVSCFALIHSLTPCFYFPFHSPFLHFPYSIIISNHFFQPFASISRSLLLSKRLHHPFRGLRRHATPRPRFAALRHPIFLVSTLPTTWPSIAPGRPLTGTHTHTPTAYTHSLIHSFTYYSYDHHHSCGEEHRQTGIPRLSAFAFERNIRQVPRNRITKNKETGCQ